MKPLAPASLALLALALLLPSACSEEEPGDAADTDDSAGADVGDDGDGGDAETGDPSAMDTGDAPIPQDATIVGTFVWTDGTETDIELEDEEGDDDGND